MPIERQPIYKAGSATNLAASAQVLSTVIDLGANFATCAAFAIKRGGVASPGEYLCIEYSDNNSTWYTAINYSLSGPAMNTTSAIEMDVGARAVGRYMRARYVNGSTAQSATAFIRLYVQPGSL